jgi:hypothetical protein
VHSTCGCSEDVCRVCDSARTRMHIARSIAQSNRVRCVSVFRDSVSVSRISVRVDSIRCVARLRKLEASMRVRYRYTDSDFSVTVRVRRRVRYAHCIDMTVRFASELASRHTGPILSRARASRRRMISVSRKDAHEIMKMTGVYSRRVRVFTARRRCDARHANSRM